MSADSKKRIRYHYGMSEGGSLFLTTVFLFLALLFGGTTIGWWTLEDTYRIGPLFDLLPPELLPWVAGSLAVACLGFAGYFFSLQVPAIRRRSYVEVTDDAITLVSWGKTTIIAFGDVLNVERKDVGNGKQLDPGLLVFPKSGAPMEIASSQLPDQGKFEIVAKAIKMRLAAVKPESADRSKDHA